MVVPIGDGIQKMFSVQRESQKKFEEKNMVNFVLYQCLKKLVELIT